MAGCRGVCPVLRLRLFLLALCSAISGRASWARSGRSISCCSTCIAGLWFGRAFVAIGLGVTALTLIGYFFVAGAAFLPWMALVNGGGLVLGGLWMRRTSAMAELDDIIHQPLRLRIMAALNALPHGAGAGILPAEEAHRRHRRQSRRPYRDPCQGRLCRGRKGLCRQEAADHGHRHRRRPRRLRPPCRDAAGDHRGLGAGSPSSRHSGARAKRANLRCAIAHGESSWRRAKQARDSGSARAARRPE